LTQEEPKAVAVVGGIGGHKRAAGRPESRGRTRAKVAALSGCYLDGERPALAIDNSMDFGRASATRAPDRLFLRPLFRPPPSDEPLL
jgi:hypothetical protein